MTPLEMTENMIPAQEKDRMTRGEIVARAYKENSWFPAHHPYSGEKCLKCNHAIKTGEKIYREISTGKPGHITCPRKAKKVDRWKS